MVKARARSETDAGGRASAVAALQAGLSVLLRLFAPYLPYVTEEVWSWGFAKETGPDSIHRAPWPTPSEIDDLAAASGDGAVFDAACAFLEAVRRAKSAAGATVGRHLASLRVAVSPRNAALLATCRFDLASASRVEGEILEPREGLADDGFEVVAIELADLPPEA